MAGQSFKDNWPKANAELMEAGNCIALDCHTACVCHLMRAFEVALLALENHLGIPQALSGVDNSWGKILGRIKDEIDKKFPKAAANPPPQEEFLRKSHALLQAFKTPYRDGTMHVRQTYGEKEAKDMMNAAIAVLRHFATVLSE